MKRLILALLFASAVMLGQPVISNVTVDNLTYSQVRIQWNTDVFAGSDYVNWGTVSGGPYPERTVKAGTGTAQTIHGVTFTVPPSATIYFTVCSTASSLQGCSSEGSFTSLAEPATEADEPLPWTPYAMPDMPTSWDKVYTVATGNCTANSTGTDTGGIQWAMDQARASTLPDSANILIKVPAGDTCLLPTGYYKTVPNVRTGGTTPAIWIVSSAFIDTPNAVPPAGVRLTENWPNSILYTMSPTCPTCIPIQNATNPATPVSKWYWRGIRFVRATPSDATKTITAATATSPIVVTAPAHGATTGQYGQVLGCSGMTGLNTLHVGLTVVDTDNISLNGTTGTGALSGTCQIQIGVPSYSQYGLIQLDASGTAVLGALKNTDWGFDQIKIEGPLDTFTGPFGAYLTYVQRMEVKNSYFKGTYRWNHIGNPTQQNAAGVAIDTTGSDYMSIVNNYINWPGISVFAQTANIGTAGHQFVSRNLMTWDKVWKVDDPSSNGLRGIVRQQMEWKSSGGGLRIQGNTIKDSWVCCGQTGTLGGSTIVLSPRADGTNNGNSLSYISDAYIGYNWLHNQAGCIYAHGAELENNAKDIRGVQRVLIEHNVCSKIDARANGQVDGSTVFGIGFYLGEAGSDFIVRRNTLVDVRGSDASLIRWYNNRGARFVVEDNLFAGVNTAKMFSWASNAITDIVPVFTDVASQSGPSLARFQNAVRQGITGNVWGAWRNNLIVPGVQDGTSYNTVGGITTATCNTQFPSTGTVCLGSTGDTPNQRYAMLKLPAFDGFDQDKLRSYIPRYDSPVKSGYTGSAFCTANPTLCLRAKDYKDLGADVERMIRELGQVENVRYYNLTSNSVKIGYIRPDSYACTVEYNTNDVWGSQVGGARILDNSGTNLNREVSLTGLASGTTYYVHLLCASEQPSFSFTTL